MLAAWQRLPRSAAPHGVSSVTVLSIEYDLFWGPEIGAGVIEGGSMNKEMTRQAKADEEILSFDVPDAVLERAGGAEQTFTLVLLY